jgi:DNA polymerase-3 subunit chi
MSPRVDFYLLPVDEPQARLGFACRLAEKAFHAGHRVYLHAADAAAVEALDDLLWSFRDSAFVPHERIDAAASHCPVLVGSGTEAPAQPEVLINLEDGVPAFFERFARVAEIVLNEPGARAAGRQRWNAYRERGCTLEHHDMQTLRSAGER